MAKNFLPETSLAAFLESLSPCGELHGPVMTDLGVPAFRPVRSADELFLAYSRTLIPPKKYLLPFRETVLHFSTTDGYSQPLTARQEIVLIGLHPCDLAGIAYLDRVFLDNDADPLYRRRRQSLTIVGLSCEADQYCFCGDVISCRETAADLFLNRVHDGFLLSSGTERGKALFPRMAGLLLEGGTVPQKVEKWPGGHAIQDACATGDEFPDSPLWDEFASRCLSCGACSACCPTCYCFDVRENGCLTDSTAKRLREWDNCLFRDHGMVAGGTNFRRTRQERFRYRYRHKYLGFGPLRGIISCVGCGRCREVCPAEIDLMELFEEQGHDYP